MKKICITAFLALFINSSINANEITVLSAIEKDTPIANAEVIFQKNGQSSTKKISNTQGKISLENGIIDDSDTTMIIKKDDFSNSQKVFQAVSQIHDLYYTSIIEKLGLKPDILDADGD